MKKTLIVVVGIMLVAAVAFAGWKTTLQYVLSGGGSLTKTLTATESGYISFMQYNTATPGTGTVQLLWVRKSLPAITNIIYSRTFTNVANVTWLPESQFWTGPGDLLIVSNTVPLANTTFVCMAE